MLDRRKFAESIKAATDKAGGLVTAALAVSGAALLIALAALILVVKVRRAS